jgi:hypothetical protein
VHGVVLLLPGDAAAGDIRDFDRPPVRCRTRITVGALDVPLGSASPWAAVRYFGPSGQGPHRTGPFDPPSREARPALS